MKVDLPAGRYIVAVSGGVDSVVLLHLLMNGLNSRLPAKGSDTNYILQTTNYKLIVAHFDHGIRPDSAEDRKFVQKLASKYNLPFVYDRANLGKGTSEAKAREARYAFLYKAQKAAGATAIITAHHQDDLLETIIINWLRGTKSRGLSSLRSTPEIRRPLLGMTKKQIRVYAHLHKLEWREDSTNNDESYLRNYVRRRIVPKLSAQACRQLLEHSEQAERLNGEIAQLATEFLSAHATPHSIERSAYQNLPEPVSREILAEWLRRNVPVGIGSKMIHRLDAAIRGGRNGSLADIARGYSLRLNRAAAELQISSQIKKTARQGESRVKSPSVSTPSQVKNAKTWPICCIL